MGLLVDGAWQEDNVGKEFGSRTTDGHFVRKPTAFHNYVTADGSPGPIGKGGFPAERGRYHLYVSLACPWAHRTLIFRKLKKLEDMISVSVTVPLFAKKGWEFGTGRHPRHHQWQTHHRRHLRSWRSSLQRPRQRSCPVGQTAARCRQQ
jgi:glutathionyl-hydroquinone reductase